MLSLNPVAACPVNGQLKPEQVPSHEERTGAVGACVGGILPPGIVLLISKFAMERFDDAMFGFQQWINCWGATPVTFTKTLVELRGLVNLKVISGAKTEKPIEQMNEVECANFLEGVAVCREENPEPTDELYECLNRRVRPQDKLVAGFTCAVTYIPQFARKEGRIISVTARTIALDLGPNPTGEGHAAKLLDPLNSFNAVLTLEDANRTEPSCYYMLEQNIAPRTRSKKSSELIEEISKQGDQGWRLPEPRNFIATVFSRRAWKGQFLYRAHPLETFTCGQGKSRSGGFLLYGCFDETGLRVVEERDDDVGSDYDGASGSRKFTPKFIQ